ncbi:MAG TPA: hypothetical protein VGZ73_08310 [Bryobacteraceae bacterium]|jgi:hypothetical protein|nr:hypothetical protein [Bryobacteraceae bacterium]
MNQRWFLSAIALALLLALLGPVPAAGQKKAWTAPHTPDGQPDLQGYWSSATLTPLERPAELAGKPFLTEQEAAAYEKQLLQTGNRDRREANAETDVGRAYNEFWFERGNKVVGTRRTSLIVDPPDGRIPPLLPEAQKIADAARAYARQHPADGPEDRGLPERCLLWPTAGPPMLPGGYNNNYQIIQSPGYVVILVEMIHDVRIIPLDGRPHLGSSVRQWMGDSRGHWEGNTLVVDTTDFNGKARFRGADEKMHLTERFTRADPDTLLYEFTVDDPTAFTKPWSAQVPMRKSEGPIFEYACHEGNYGMEGILGGARAEEKKAAAGAGK